MELPALLKDDGVGCEASESDTLDELERLVLNGVFSSLNPGAKWKWK